ncbi:MAG: endolytic transglycosylase MltG [Thermodesulfobacteriota bacterium]
MSIAKSRWIPVALAVAVTVAAAVWLHVTRYMVSPADLSAREQVIVVPPGMGINAAAAMLHRQGVIKHPDLFRFFARVARRGHAIKAGEYRLSAAMPPAAILDLLLSGKVALHRLTIPEGYSMYQIAELAERTGLAKKDDFLAAAEDTALAKKLGVPADTLEGYLFPETYYFPMSATPQQMAAAMVDRFFTVFTDEWENRAARMGMSVHQIVTLASIIEKETGHPDERPLIASVFHNRLAKNMRLESDPTVIYGIPDFGGNITKAHLRQETPYNTYRIKGLPAGPISNPGREALYAALFPAQTGYLYFVSKNDGTHQFSATLAEHNQAVRTYQLRGRARPSG